MIFGGGAAHRGIGGIYAIGQLKNRKTGDIISGSFIGGGLGIGLQTPGVDPGFGDWADFTTDDAYNFTDFDGTFARLTIAGAGIGIIGYALAWISFPKRGANGIYVGGANMGAIGADASTNVGTWVLHGRSDFVSDRVTPASENTSQNTQGESSHLHQEKDAEFTSKSSRNSKVDLTPQLKVLNATPEQEKIVKTAIENARFLVNKAQTHIGGERRAGYKRWFDQGYSRASVLSRKRLQAVRRGWIKLHSVMQSKKIVVDCSTINEPKFAHVFIDDQAYKIFLGRDFWSASNSGRDSKPGVIVHELSHEELYTDDHAYGEKDAETLAIHEPDKAINNADNWEYFAEDFS
jgi:hypothetical protein